jgi:hypothetical protein
VIDVLGNGFNLTNVDAGVTFDVNVDGTAEHAPWTAINSDDAWSYWTAIAMAQLTTVASYSVSSHLKQTHQQAIVRTVFFALEEHDKPSRGGNSDGSIIEADHIFTSVRL